MIHFYIVYGRETSHGCIWAFLPFAACSLPLKYLIKTITVPEDLTVILLDLTLPQQCSKSKNAKKEYVKNFCLERKVACIKWSPRALRLASLLLSTFFSLTISAIVNTVVLSETKVTQVSSLKNCNCYSLSSHWLDTFQISYRFISYRCKQIYVV